MQSRAELPTRVGARAAGGFARAYDADNYACVDGGCPYTGCNGEAACDALDAQGTQFTCADVNGASWCTVQCTTTSDCTASPEEGAVGPDNDACAGGVCEYLGCTRVHVDGVP